MTRSLQRRAQHSTRTWRDARIPLAIGDPRRRDGAFMEPSGRNRWQPLANGTSLKTAQWANWCSPSVGGGGRPLRKTGVGEPPPDPSIADALEQRLLRIGSEVEHTLVQRERRELPVQDARTRRVSPRARLGFGPGLATPRLSTSGARLRLAGMPLTDSCHRTS
jgi:hypothetical protein